LPILVTRNLDYVLREGRGSENSIERRISGKKNFPGEEITGKLSYPNPRQGLHPDDWRLCSPPFSLGRELSKEKKTSL